MKSIVIISAAALFLGEALGQEIVRVPEETKGLQNRWTWAESRAEQKGFDKGVWIAYSMDVLMREDSWIGSFHTIPEPSERSLYEIITGRRIENPGRWDVHSDVKGQARRFLSKDKRTVVEEKKVTKELAFLFEFDGKPSDVASLRDIHPTNVELDVDLKGKPLIWIGKVTAEESIGFLASYYTKMKTTKQKQTVIVAVGVHEQNQAAYSFLRSIVNSGEEDKMRSDAVFWIGQQDSQEALEFLLGVAQKDRSRRVAKQGVFAISQISLDAATDALVKLGRNGESREVRKDAVFWLGQRASKRVVESLKDFVFEGEDSEIQKQAIFALSQIRDDDAMGEIIKIAKTHPNPKVRKQAIFWLGQSDDPRAFDAVVEIAKGK